MIDRGRASGERRSVFHALDLLRGVAAVAVMLYHKKSLPLSSTSAYLAVDLFFLLSGVVVAEAYANRMAAGWSIQRFMLVRIVRLWPLYMVGTLISLIAVALSLYTGVTPFWHGNISKIMLFAMLFLPGFHQWEGLLFPLNGAAWSLFAELLVNLLFAVVYRTRLTRWWLILVAVSTAFIAFEMRSRAASTNGINIGAFIFLPGIARAFFSFTVGVALHQVWRAGKLRIFRVPAATIIGAFLILILLTPAHGAGATLWALITIGIGFPILVALALNTTAGPFVQRISAFSGRISYPIYTTHLPAFAILEVCYGGPDAPPTIAFWIVAASVVALAVPLDRYVDAPVRKWLSHQFGLSGRSVSAAKPL